MYNNYSYLNMPYPMPYQKGFNKNNVQPTDDRLVGGFAFPFLLGGVTGAAIAPAFYGGYNRPNNNYYYPPYYNPYYYGPYYR